MAVDAGRLQPRCASEGLPIIQVAVALGGSVYLWNASSGTIDQLTELGAPDEYVTSVAWAADGKHVAVGTSSAEVQIWAAGGNRVRQVRSLKGHSARVSALSWNGATLSSGGRDTLILNHDVRCVPLQQLSDVIDLVLLELICPSILLRN